MNLNEISSLLAKVSDIYAQRFGIERDRDWYLLKIQEELGELTKIFLQMSHRARKGEETQEILTKNLQDEIADVIAMTILFARTQDIDVETALGSGCRETHFSCKFPGSVCDFVKIEKSPLRGAGATPPGFFQFCLVSTKPSNFRSESSFATATK